MDSYQISFDDLSYLENISKLPGRSAFIDECGSFGFDFCKEGVSTHYVVCAVIVNNKDIGGIEQKIEEIQRNKFGGSEMKSSSISNNHHRRINILTELLMLDFSLIILIADKQAFHENSPLTKYKGTFVKYLHRLLYDSMYCAYPKLKIVEDEYGTSEFQKGYRQYIRTNRPALNLFDDYDFDYVDSKNSNIVQIADIIAGSVMQHIIDTNAPDALKLFQSRIRDVIRFPKVFTPKSEKMGDDSYYDAQIYNLAHKRAINYIEQNRNDLSEEVRLRSLFLRLLLFSAENFGESQYIYAGKIVQELSDLSETKVTRDFLYRRIVAKLRDEDVLIASSSHGYKIPTCTEDIRTYIAQTDTVVSPMLARIGKCRSLISKETDGKLDILNAAEFQGYKRYFGDY
ncbi:DUF3800 domain-containing protein [Caproiciproducens sp. CPB-2]|uniref:DUF3800 domain-containing protein n=1 Tax=Caproiciproducens sp. CPB-2 TaxID=3030017 RepID=UPI0023DB5741|nr:DUF3800 domain-containing protein [Caproiciproducens sp. CPB-2]MDF1495816.1 DUF3800 domain-containing protein [Caproiciproducens sp. CPB-2]